MKKKLCFLAMCCVLSTSNATCFCAESSEEDIAFECDIEEFDEIFKNICEEFVDQAVYATESESEYRSEILSGISEKYGLKIGDTVKIRGMLVASSGSSICLIPDDYDGTQDLLVFKTDDSRFEAIDWKEPVAVKAVFDPIFDTKISSDSRPFLIDFLDAELVSPQEIDFRFENNLDAFLNEDYFRDPVRATIKDVYSISDLPDGVECPDQFSDIAKYYFTLASNTSEIGVYLIRNENAPSPGDNIAAHIHVSDGISFTAAYYNYNNDSTHQNQVEKDLSNK